MAELHKPITGGCLCESVRYTVSFPAKAQWPPQAHTCQCTQCRKNTGSLILHFITVPPANISWALPKPGPAEPSSSNPTTTFREYASSPGCFRGFCENCGTTLTWRKERNGDEMEIMLGTVDEECLERELCLPITAQYWCRNFIKDVTDVIPTGDKWFENNGENGVKLS